MSSSDTPVVRADRVLTETRILSIVIVPFLLAAFVLLYFWPSAQDTGRLFAWRIIPPFTSMTLAAVYLGGAYFFLLAARAQRWHTVGGGFLSVGLFASLMGIATIVHWSLFIHTNVAFWLWAGLYFTTPFLVFAVWWRNRVEEPPVPVEDLVLSKGAARLIGLVGALASAACLLLSVAPGFAIDVWPWTLTPLTARVMGAIFALAAVGIAAFRCRRWSGVRILLQVEGLMLVLIAVAIVRARNDFVASRPLTWLFAAGFVALAAGSAALYVRMQRRTVQAGPPLQRGRRWGHRPEQPG
jgi:hypothetical protein